MAFHTLFNTLGVIAVLPATGAFARLIIWLIPEGPVLYTQRLDRSLYESPAMAIEAVRTTLREVTLRVFELLESILGRAEPDETQAALAEANAALERTREYLEMVDTSAHHELLYPRYFSTIHTIDHLRRLIDRCEETDRADLASRTADLAATSDELRAAVWETRAELGQLEGSATVGGAARMGAPEDRPAAARLKAIWDQLETDAEPYRHAVIDAAARKHVDSDTTIGKLDAHRWLRRVSYHVWRIMHHLGRTQLDAVAPAAEEIPPHREQEKID